MCDTFIGMLRDIDLLYGFIYECAYLIYMSIIIMII